MRTRWFGNWLSRHWRSYQSVPAVRLTQRIILCLLTFLIQWCFRRQWRQTDLFLSSSRSLWTAMTTFPMQRPRPYRLFVSLLRVNPKHCNLLYITDCFILLEDRKEFLSLLIADLNATERPVRLALYNVLQGKKSDGVSSLRHNHSLSSLVFTCLSATFREEIYSAICRLLIQMQYKDLSFISQSIAMLKEILDAGVDFWFIFYSSQTILFNSLRSNCQR